MVAVIIIMLSLCYVCTNYIKAPTQCVGVFCLLSEWEFWLITTIRRIGSNIKLIKKIRTILLLKSLKYARQMKEFKFQEITKRIIGAAMKVHSILCNGFQEVIYQRALAIKFTKAGLLFVQEFCISIFYDGIIIGKRSVDFFVENLISVELKTNAIIEPAHFSLARNYLEVHNLEVGMLLNFGNISLEFKQLENTKYNLNLKIQTIQTIVQNHPFRQ